MEKLIGIVILAIIYGFIMFASILVSECNKEDLLLIYSIQLTLLGLIYINTDYGISPILTTMVVYSVSLFVSQFFVENPIFVSSIVTTIWIVIMALSVLSIAHSR